jgi:thiamine pyrophosphate-dependent acetolactate synthase large subunit-like protein
MITKQRTLFYFVGDQAFKSLEEAQKADLKKLMESLKEDRITCTGEPKELDEAVSDWLLTNSAAIVDCLTTTPRSRLRARKTHGAERKPRSDIGKKRTPKAETPATI